MRILHVISSLGGGGAEAVLYRLCTASSDRTDHTVVSLTTEGVYGERLRAAGTAVRALGMPRRRPSPGGIFKLMRIIRETRPDVVQTWLYHGDLIGGIAARLVGERRVVWGLHNSYIDPITTPRSTRLVVKACALAARAVPARIASCSERAASLHIGLGYPADRMVVVANGYDCDAFRPDPPQRSSVRREIGLLPEEPVVGLVARFDPQKDVDNLLDAMAELSSAGVGCACLLVGSGMTTDNMALAASIRRRSLADRVHLLGQRSDIPAVMNALDLLVLPSAYGEAFPNVVAEAMACETPVVTTDVGDSALIVGDTGWVVPPRDSHALASAIGEALSERGDAAAHARRRTACRDRIVGNFSLARMVAGYDRVWRQTIESIR